MKVAEASRPGMGSELLWSQLLKLGLDRKTRNNVSKCIG